MKSIKKIDLNADLGEYTTEDELRNEISLIQCITSASIACGGHAGDQTSMNTMIDHCIQNNVLFGPHPSYPDKKGFGRNALAISDKSLMQSIEHQISVFMDIAKGHDTEPTHIKLHGQLYNDCFSDKDLSELCLRALDAACPNLALICQSNSQISHMAKKSGLNVIHEAFIDRNYQANGALIGRINRDAVILSKEDQARQALSIVFKGEVMTHDSKHIQIEADTLCIHGDNPDSISMAIQAKKILEENGCQIIGYEF